MVNVPSPAVSIVGRHNSGKTTLIEKLIAELVGRGYDVGSIKHHTHKGFDIDYPGKDSYRHRAAGASETVIAAPGQMARVKTIENQGEVECSEIVASMPGHDIIVVEGYRKSGLPTIEIMRAGNPADVLVAEALLDAARSGASLGGDAVQRSREVARGRKHAALIDGAADQNEEAAEAEATEAVAAETAAVADSVATAADATVAEEPMEMTPEADLKHKMPTSDTVAIVTDIEEARMEARLFNIPAFDFGEIDDIVRFLEKRYVRPRVSVVIQAGGESRRMGQSKALVPFLDRPLICRLIERLAPVSDELLITTNEGERLTFLHDMYPEVDIKLVPDAFTFRGALPGMFTAMQAARNPYVAVVACDMVFASGRLVVAESLMMAETDADVVVPVNKHGFEPFHALYRKKRCLPAIRRALDRGERRAQSFFDDRDIDVAEFSQERVLAAEPRGGCFINANTPEELKRLEDSYLGE